ncbi:MAG: response regulator, partial [Spirochaetales bacterium]|nr:response regulator [Spirochaetales bacterium]
MTYTPIMKENTSEYICLIDDEYQVIKSLVRELKEYAEENKITIRIYPSPNECMQDLALIGEETSVIISDLRMPGMKGSDFFLSVCEKFPDIELILLTAFNDIDDIKKAIKAKIRSLILKPWDEDDLLNEIDKARSIYLLKKEKIKIQEMLDKQLEVAGDFQKSLLNSQIPEIENAKIELSYLPFKMMKMGGDYYDIIKLDDSRF